MAIGMCFFTKRLRVKFSFGRVGVLQKRIVTCGFLPLCSEHNPNKMICQCNIPLGILLHLESRQHQHASATPLMQHPVKVSAVLSSTVVQRWGGISGWQEGRRRGRMGPGGGGIGRHRCRSILSSLPDLAAVHGFTWV